MQSNTNNSDHGPPEDTDDIEAYVRKHFRIILEMAYEKGDITERMWDSLSRLKPIELDEVDDAAKQLIHAVKHKEYYFLLDRIEKGEEMLEKASDLKKKSQYSKLLKSLTQELERVRPG